MKTKLCSTLIFYFLAACLAVWFSACGGGGGGGGGITGTTYKGVTTQAQITEDNAVDLAVGTWNGTDAGTDIDILGAVQINREFYKNPFSMGLLPFIFDEVVKNMGIKTLTTNTYLGAVQSVSTTITGSCNGDGTSGTIVGGAAVEGSVDDATGELSATVTFNDYCEYEEGGVIINGLANISGSLDPATIENELPEFFHYALTFTALTLENMVTDESMTINGSFSADYVQTPMLITMSFVLTDNTISKTYWIKDLQVRATGAENYVDIVSITGTYYDHDEGYVGLSIGSTIRIYDMENWPSSGSFILTGAQGTKARLTFVSATQFLVEADTTGDGVYNYIEGPYSWMASIGYLDPYIFSENASFVGLASGYINYYSMKTQVKAESAAESIYIENNTIKEQIPYSPILDLLSPPYFTYMKRFGISSYNPPGVTWEDMHYTFFADSIINGMLDAGEAFATCDVPVGAFSQMDIPVVSVTDSNSPTVSWQPVSGAASYLINFFELTAENALGNLVFSVKILDDGGLSYSYTYDGDLFDSYPMLAIMLVAKDNDSSCYYNRSVFVTTHGK